MKRGLRSIARGAVAGVTRRKPSATKLAKKITKRKLLGKVKPRMGALTEKGLARMRKLVPKRRKPAKGKALQLMKQPIKPRTMPRRRTTPRRRLLGKG